jgi:AcrR family transcriptional regulator
MNAIGILQEPEVSQENETYSDHSSRPVIRNPQNKRDALVVAATKLFAARGYRATTTRDIAACAGCAEGLIHRYFHGKLGLLQAVLDAHSLRDSANLDAEIPSAQSLEDEVVQLLNWLLDRIWRDSDIFRTTVGCTITKERPEVTELRVLPRGLTAIDARLRRHNLPERTVHLLSQAIQGMAISFGLLYPIALGYDRSEAAQLALSAACLMCRGINQVDLNPSALASSQQAFSND